jgi:hypothetical protein
MGGVHRVFGFAPAKMPTKLAYLTHREPPPLPVRYRWTPQPVQRLAPQPAKRGLFFLKKG